MTNILIITNKLLIFQLLGTFSYWNIYLSRKEKKEVARCIPATAGFAVPFARTRIQSPTEEGREVYGISLRQYEIRGVWGGNSSAVDVRPGDQA